MKPSPTTLFALALALCFLAPAGNVQANCWEGKAQCVRYKAGKQVKSAMCEVFECANQSRAMGGARFPNKKRGGDATWYANRRDVMYADSACVDGECSAAEYTLDGRPAVRMQKGPKRGEWTCFKKKNANEVMCVNKEALF